MSTTRMLVYLILVICALGGFSVLMRITLERNRLVGRYLHIKKILEHREALRIKVEKKNQEVAQSASDSQPVLSDAPMPGEEVYTVEAVGEV